MSFKKIAKSIIGDTLTDAASKINIDSAKKIIDKKIDSITNNINTFINATDKSQYITEKDDKQYKMSINVAGVSKKNIKVTKLENLLNIVAANGNFKYNYSINIDNDKIKSIEIKHGILNATMIIRDKVENIDIK
jgi:HSP20 family molecular chaperone IbpA